MFRRQPTRRPLPPAIYDKPTQPPAEIDHEAQLSPAQRQPIDWAAPEERTLPAKPVTSYVPSASELMRTPQVTIASPDAHVDANIVPAALVESRTLGTHRDRADAWLRYSLPLSVVAALVVTVVAKTLYEFPLLSWSAFITLGLSFMICYGALLFRYWETSPEGVALYHTKQLWKLFHSQQKHRQQLEREEYRRGRRG